MKTYSIGRDLSCDIVINDNTDIISRRHAILYVTQFGKMTIVDQSSNGTYINGIRISQNVPVPVSRNDSVSLAHVAKLDWNMVPKSTAWINYLLYGIGCAALVAIMLFVFVNFGHNKPMIPDNPPAVVTTDSTTNAPQPTQPDSLQKANEQQQQEESNAKRRERKKQEAEKKQKEEEAQKQKQEAEQKKKKEEQAKQDSIKQAQSRRTIG